MNYDIKAELLAEGWKHEQLIEEDWEELKKELADLYVAGKITERQISTRLSKAGMGGLSRNAAYKITHDPDNVQKREINLQRARTAEEKKEKEAAKKADPNYGKTRGTLAQEYCNAWNKKFGHIVKAGVVKEALEDELCNYLIENDIELSEEEQLELVAETMNEILSENLLTEAVAQNNQDVKMFYDDGTWSLVSPITFKGAKKVSYYIEDGKKVPTHWATRAQERHFDAFTKNGPLYIIRNTKTGKAYQIGKFNGEALFQDQDDMPISKAERASIPRSLLSRIKGVSASAITENCFNY